MKKPVIIGIAGGSGSGKTTVQRRVMDKFSPDIAVLDHDSYYRDLSHLPHEERTKVNFDHPDSLETELMVRHVDSLLKGFAVEKPTYDFSKHSRADKVERITPKPVIIVEGILIFAEPELRKRMDLRVFVDADPDIRLIRRIRRDIHERGRSIESILTQYEKSVQPMYMEFVEPSKRFADIIITRGGHNEAGISMLLAHVEQLVATNV
ncbi:MAG TPA: uridine kinase [Rhodothermales bacterium]|nr:uridine kinase [Rhodothermales bacterium]